MAERRAQKAGAGLPRCPPRAGGRPLSACGAPRRAAAGPKPPAAESPAASESRAGGRPHARPQPAAWGTAPSGGGRGELEAAGDDGSGKMAERRRS